MFTKDKQVTVQYKLANSNLEYIINGLRAKYGINPVPAETLFPEYNLPLLRVTNHQLIIEHQGGNLFFHPSMALLRMLNISRGIEDRFLQATRLLPGDVFLDATMGLASDSLLAAWKVGKEGKVFAVEGSRLLHLLVSEGLAGMERMIPEKVKNREKLQAWKELAEAAGRIVPVCADHLAFLQDLPDSSVDVIYFDPMFRNTLAGSSASIRPLKDLSIPEPLTADAVNQACRAARRWVVLKERKRSGEFERLGFQVLNGGKYSNICFGRIALK